MGDREKIWYVTGSTTIDTKRAKGVSSHTPTARNCTISMKRNETIHLSSLQNDLESSKRLLPLNTLLQVARHGTREEKGWFDSSNTRRDCRSQTLVLS